LQEPPYPSRETTASISTAAPFGRELTSTVARAGYGLLKNSPYTSLTSAKEGVTFDLLGHGAYQTSWVKGTDDALLAIDLNGNGIIDQGTELLEGIFTRTVRFDIVQRLNSNCTGNIIVSGAGCTNDTNTRKVTVTVSWSNGEKEVILDTYISNWKL